MIPRRWIPALLLTSLALTGCHATVAHKPTEPATDLPEGSWSGSTSGSTGTTATGTPSGPPVVNYPGFEVLRDGSSVVSLQVRGPVQVAEQRVEGRIVYSLSGVAVPERVNRLPLVTQYFATQVTSVTVEQTTGGANLVLELREPATSTFALKQNEAGTLLTIVVPRSEKYGVRKTDEPTKPTGDPERPNFDDPDQEVAARPESSTDETGISEQQRERSKKRRSWRKSYPRRVFGLGVGISGGVMALLDDGIPSASYFDGSNDFLPLFSPFTLEGQIFLDDDDYSFDLSIPITNTILLAAFGIGAYWQSDVFFNFGPGEQNIRMVLGPGLGFGVYDVDDDLSSSQTFGSVRLLAEIGLEALNNHQTFSFKLLARPFVELFFSDAGYAGTGAGGVGLISFSGNSVEKRRR